MSGRNVSPSPLRGEGRGEGPYQVPIREAATPKPQQLLDPHNPKETLKH